MGVRHQGTLGCNFPTDRRAFQSINECGHRQKVGLASAENRDWLVHSLCYLFIYLFMTALGLRCCARAWSTHFAIYLFIYDCIGSLLLHAGFL